MKVCLCFSGQMRTFSKTVDNIKKNIISSDHEYTILYCCWTTENTEDFEREFPTAHIKRIEQPDINGEKFQTWYKNISPCIRFEYPIIDNKIYNHMSGTNRIFNKNNLNTYNNMYNYYLQLYGYKEMAEYIDNNKFLHIYDVFIRLRCDCIYNKPIYNEFKNVQDNILYCSIEPSYREFIEHESLCDQFFMGSRNVIISILNIIEYLPDLKFNGTDRWLNSWENIIHPESSLYKALIYNGFTEKYIEELKIQILR